MKKKVSDYIADVLAGTGSDRYLPLLEAEPCI